MTVCDVKMKFEAVMYMDRLINAKLEDIKEMRRKLSDVGSPAFGERVQATRDHDKFTGAISKIIEMENEVNAEIDRLVDLKAECRVMVEGLEKNLHKLIMYQIYFSGKTMGEVAEMCNKSIRQIANIKNACFVQIAENQKLH